MRAILPTCGAKRSVQLPGANGQYAVGGLTPVIVTHSFSLETLDWWTQAAAVSAALPLTWTERTRPEVQEAVIGVLFVLASTAQITQLANDPRGGQRWWRADDIAQSHNSPESRSKRSALLRTTITPTPMVRRRLETLAVSRAANGAAINAPITRPTAVRDS